MGSKSGAGRRAEDKALGLLEENQDEGWGRGGEQEGSVVFRLK